MDIEKFGPQSPSDYPFQRKARLLQSYYRTVALNEPFGFGPWRTSRTKYGNMLVAGDKTGKNFLSTEIFKYAQRKVDEKKTNPQLTIDEFRLFNNMLSSMPMCFNLFYPLKYSLESMVVQKAIKAAFPYFPIEKVVSIDIEFIPLPLSDYIEDKSAFDAFIIFEDMQRQAGVIGIETKYTDKLGKNKTFKNEKKAQIAESAGIFTDEAISSIKSDGCTQIIRNVLLTESYRLKHHMKYSQSVILSPTEEPFSDEEVTDFKALLSPNGQCKISRITLEHFVSTVYEVVNAPLREHLEQFRRRYLDFKQIADYL